MRGEKEHIKYISNKNLTMSNERGDIQKKIEEDNQIKITTG